jgi:hypothetical protein
MANNFITIDATTRLGSQLRSAVVSMQGTLDAMIRLKAIMDQQTDAVVWATIEAQFGLPAGKGQATYNLLTGALAACNVTATQQFTQWLG